MSQIEKAFQLLSDRQQRAIINRFQDSYSAAVLAKVGDADYLEPEQRTILRDTIDTLREINEKA